ncbi:hypothetical protein M9H77_30178 [Catharanthus roseus]|uniref:Uncharacterized protein n=1 Tax=Catharanthus roseus TaxID=4058 RepID=A0ACB9ZWW7_CATRO|nr:hypothetical protein M9H77_30178 [Catharanthus roseus]
MNWKAQRILRKFFEDTRNQFERFEGQTTLIIEEIQNRSGKAKTKPTGDESIEPSEESDCKRQEGLKTIKVNMEDDLHHVQQALKGLEQQLSCLAKGVMDLRREEEAILEQSSRRNLGGYPMHNNQLGYGNFSSHGRSYELNSYECCESNRLETRNVHNCRTYNRVPRNEVRNERNYVNVNMEGRFHKRRGDYERYNDSYNYGGYSCGRSSQTLGTTLRPLSYNNLKLPLLWDTCSPYDYEA